ncbi:MAG: glycoside hydrolase domain-containing protein, partial [bacterium]
MDTHTGIRIGWLSLFILVPIVCTVAQISDETDVPYGVGDWPQELGNHRARVFVQDRADAVWVHIPWRRRDLAPHEIDISILDEATKERITNRIPLEINREYGDLVFQPRTVPGTYSIYYMPFKKHEEPWAYSVEYLQPESTADSSWLARHKLTPDLSQNEAWKSLPKSEVLEIQARGEFHRFDPMEITATAEETRELLNANPNRSYLLFPENRKYPIRMRDNLPLRWIRRGVSSAFSGEAQRGEFYAFQIGVYAAHEPIDDIAIGYSDLNSEQGGIIPASAFQCVNVGGSDWLGRPFTKTFSVDQGTVRALWFGLSIPVDTQPGMYHGTLTLKPVGKEETRITLALNVLAEIVEECGDGEPWRHSRLRWLNSAIGIDNGIVAPYTPMTVQDRTVTCLGRFLRIADSGFPESIRSGNLEILAKPINLVIEAKEGEIPWVNQSPKIVEQPPGAVIWESRSIGSPFEMTCQAKMEFDGYINFQVRLKANAACRVQDIHLEIPLRREIATYMMGMGRKGGYRPEKWVWEWDISRANNSLWIGDVDAGLHCKLKGTEDSWDLYTLQASGIPESWGNSGRGGCVVAEEGAGQVAIKAYSGRRELKSGDELQFNFGLLITPVKPLDPAHWKQRYYHKYVPVDQAVQAGASIINIHHGNELNPNINYPFLAADKLAEYIKEAHNKDRKVKIYYTVRELSNYVAEMWALRSLGSEVFVPGPGGGSSWLREHLVSDYAPAWHHTFPDGTVDAAILTTGLSLWHNYYLEGLAWLLRNVKIDGLYLDGIGYDREIMKRVRKVLDRERPGSLIDFHSGNNFHPQYGLSNCANQYMEHFPYIDSLWFGEGFDYNESPDFWLVEVSGIPFGLYGDMLQGGGNPWRGMVYGMTCRYYYDADPGAVWRFWDGFGIHEAQMIGYWVSSCPVRTGRGDVLATVYRKPRKTLISLASWAEDTVQCQLDIDWEAIGLNPEKSTLYAPPIRNFQEAAEFKPTDEIPVEPGRGWLLILEE